MKRKTKKCSNCEGTGKIVYYDWAPDTYKGSAFSHAITDDKPCYKCKGTGKEEVI